MNLSTLRAAAVVSIPAALSVAKGLIAKQFGSPTALLLADVGDPIPPAHN